jgi:hypothetical protein
MQTEQTVAAPATPAPAAAPKAIKVDKRPSKPVVTKPVVKAKKAAKPAAKAKPVKKAAKPVVGDRLVPADLANYVISKDKPTPAGNPSIDCDDKVAVMLRGKDLNAVYDLVAKQTAKQDDAMSVSQLKAKYKHLNVGMQRMNLGNKLRGVLNAK